jgi:hypothetical protein
VKREAQNLQVKAFLVRRAFRIREAFRRISQRNVASAQA